MKKLNFKSLLAFGLSVIVLFSLSFQSFVEADTLDVTSGLSPIAKTEGYQLITKCDNLSLYLDSKTTNFYVEDAETGNRTYAWPEKVDDDKIASLAQQMEMQSALVFSFWEPEKKTETRKNSKGLCINQGNYEVFAQKEGFLIKYELASQKVSICLSVTLKDGKLFCTIPAGSIIEKDTENNMLIKVAVLPYMISGKAGTEGEIVLPDGCGEILDFSTTRSASEIYSKPIYGRNMSNTLSIESKDGYDINCPYLALCSGGTGVLAIPEKGAAVGYVNASPAGKSSSYANAYFSYDYRATDIAVIGDKQSASSQSTRVLSDDVYDDDFTISYQFIYKNVDKSTLAKIYGDFLAPASKAVDTNVGTIIFDIYGFVTEQKSFLGFPYKATSVLSKGEDIIDLANSDKYSSFTINLKNITNADKKQIISTDVTPVSKVISKSELKLLNKANAKIVVDINAVSFKKNTFWANKFFGASEAIYGAPVAHYEYRESTHMVNKNIAKSYLLKHTKLAPTLEKATKSVGKLGMDGISSAELGCMSYHDYSNGGTLEDTRASVEKAISLAAQSGSLILESPHDYAIKYCSAITNIPTTSSNTDICCGSYPFLQIALGGHIVYTVEPINLYRSPETMFLNAIATGSSLHYSYILSDTEPVIGTELNYLYSADYSSFEQMTERQSSEYDKVLAVTESSGLVDWSNTDNIITAVFDNGATIHVDLNKKTYSAAR